MIELIKLLEELKPPPPEKIYEPGSEPGREFLNLTTKQEKELLSKGQILIPIEDPTRTSASEVIRLPKIKDMKRVIKDYSNELRVFKSSNDKDLKMLGEELTSKLNYVGKLLNTLDAVLKTYKKDD